MPLITFNRIEDSEGDENRGWRVDRLEAFIVGRPGQQPQQKVGHLTLGYIPRDRFKRWYKDRILSHLSMVRGHHFIPTSIESTGRVPPSAIADLPMDELRRCVRDLVWSLNRIDYSERERQAAFQLKTRSDLLGIVKEMLPRITRRHGVEYDAFRRHEINRPKIDFIQVEERFRRNGIAMRLYAHGAVWMHEKGLALYASTLQSAEAAAVWQKMTDAGWVKKKEKRRIIDPQVIPRLREYLAAADARDQVDFRLAQIASTSEMPAVPEAPVVSPVRTRAAP